MFEKVKALAENFFRLMGVTIDEFIITEDAGEKSIFNIAVKTPDSKLLIGIHGQTLEIIKQLMSRMIERSLGIQITLHLEINDYIKSREEKLFRYIDSRIDYAIEQQREIILPTMTSYERKKAHSHIADRNIPWLRSFSVGEGENRRLHISYGASASKPVSASESDTMLNEEGIGI